MSPAGRPQLRGIFGPKGDSLQWLETVAPFPNGVPRFASRDEALAFLRTYHATQNTGSNPDHPGLQHMFTMLVGWEQMESILLPGLRKARQEVSFAGKVPLSYGQGDHHVDHTQRTSNDHRTNIYETPEALPVVQAIQQRLDVPFHACTTPVSTENTLHYLFHHMKCGLFVMIRNQQVRIFAPFVNIDYRNTWSEFLSLEGDGTLDSYYTQKAGLYREEVIEPDRSKWWANGNIICNELQKKDAPTQHWGDHFLAPLRDMLAEACRERKIPDCEFFLNKRDYPQLKVNVAEGIENARPVEPYGFIFDKDDRDPDQDVPLCPQHSFATYAPIVSFYAAAPDRFTDIPWPSSEDWEAACGLVFPHSFQHGNDGSNTPEGITIDGNPRDLFTEANFRKFERGWNDGRVATAFFRGTATGGGTTIETNQRLKVAYLSHKWKKDPVKGGDEPYLDAAIVGWNCEYTV